MFGPESIQTMNEKAVIREAVRHFAEGNYERVAEILKANVDIPNLPHRFAAMLAENHGFKVVVNRV